MFGYKKVEPKPTVADKGWDDLRQKLAASSHSLDDIALSLITLQIINAANSMKIAVKTGKEVDYEYWDRAYEEAVSRWYEKRREIRSK